MKYKLYNILFIYMIATNLLQILLIDAKGNVYDSLWKIFILGVLIVFAFFKSLKVKQKISKKKLFFWGVFVLISSITLIFNGDLENFNSSIMVSFFFPIICSFIFLVLFGQQTIDERGLEKFLKMFIFYVLYMCIYNFIVNFDVISNFMNISSAYQVDIASFYNNRNTFAYYLIFGIISTTMLIKSYEVNKNVYLPILLFFIINIILTLSRTAMLSVLIFYFILFLFNSKRKQKITLFLLIGICLMIVSFVPSINSFVFNNLVRADSGVTGRGAVWNFGVDLLRKSNMFFGLGYDEPHMLLTMSYLGISSFHSTFLTLLLCGGLLLFSCFLGIILYSFIIAVKIKYYNKKIGLFFVSIIMVYLCYGVTESQIIFFSSSTNFVATSFVCLIPTYVLNYYKGKRDENENKKFT